MSGEARVLRDIEIAVGALPGVLVRRGAVMVQDIATGRRRFLPGLGPGTPDLVVCVEGRWVGLEVKGDDGRPEPTQLDMQRHIRAAGGVYEFVWSTEEARGVIEQAFGRSR
jgi:hypothetical protein